MNSLIAHILSGDERAVVSFYKTFSPKIVRYLQKHLPQHEAQEILNDVFLEAVDAMPTLKKETNLSAWLYKIAHNKMVDYYRKQKIKSVFLSQLPFLELVAKEIDQPEFQLEKNKLRDKIENALHSLSQKYQEILRMHYEDQIPVKDIAQILQLSFKATESRLYRARQGFIQAYERG
jgi:RNA polymerase sigma-70 factor, ECF subfamily